LFEYVLIAISTVPVKFEHVVFCKLSPLQLDLYNVFITSKAMQKLLRGQGSQPLKVRVNKGVAVGEESKDVELRLSL
jgi:SNF2 family DNA or RNA helicase